MIVIPMAGLSRRFAVAGYTIPKYMLPLRGKTVFARAVASFSALFDTEPFVFIARRVAETEEFLKSECDSLGIANARVVMLEQETAGQAETVEFGLRQAGVSEHSPITIFNIDTFREGFCYPQAQWFARSDGYLEVFRGTGANWSYVKPLECSSEPLVARTVEKQPISDLCCDGLYHFARIADYFSALAVERRHPSMPELYVAPLYNHLIATGGKIHYDLIPEQALTFCGVPSEYEAVLNNEN